MHRGNVYSAWCEKFCLPRLAVFQFAKLTRTPIVIYFGDFIPDHLDGTQGGEQWHIRMKMAQQFVDTVNKHGGKAKLIHLPQ